MSEKKETKPFRVNIRMSKSMVDFYDDMANEMGVARSYVMVMALKQYIDQQKAMQEMSNVKGYIEAIEKLKQVGIDVNTK